MGEIMNKSLKDKGLHNRERLIHLMNEAENKLRTMPIKERPFRHLTQKQISELLTDEEHHCTLRAVQYWLADPTSTSFRYCKDWVPVKLEEKLKKYKLI